MKPNLLRVFIAVNLSDELRRTCKTLQSELSGKISNVRWVDPKNLHITLKFLGEVDASRVSEIKDALDTLTATSLFTLNLEQVGVFPDLKRPYVIWVGVGSGKEELEKVFLQLEAQLFSRGFPRDNRKFSPHLTIGRCKGKTETNLERLLGTYQSWKSSDIEVSRIDLMSSQLTEEGSVYTTLFSIKLAK